MLFETLEVIERFLARWKIWAKEHPYNILGITVIIGMLLLFGQTYFILPYQAYLLIGTALFGSYAIGMLLPHRNKREKVIGEMLETPSLETLQEPEEDAV